MNPKRFLFIFFIIVSILINGSFSAFAINTGFTTNELSSEDKQTFLSNFELILLTEEPQKNAVTCFDVNEDGLVAIGTENASKKSIWIYTSNGTFQYGYEFDSSGSFGVEWDGNNIIIYLVRSDLAVLVDEKGTVLELYEIENTVENNSYWNHSVFTSQREVNESRYIMKNDMGLLNILASSYSQVVKIDYNENETIIYDFSDQYAAKVIVVSMAAIVFAAVVVSVIVFQFKKGRAKIAMPELM